MATDETFEKKYKEIQKEINSFDVISVTVLQRKFSIGYVNATIAIQRLLAEDLIVPMPEDYKYKVVK